MRFKFLYKSVLAMVFFATSGVLDAQTSLSIGGQFGLASLNSFITPGPGGRIGADVRHRLGPRWDFSVGMGLVVGWDEFSESQRTGTYSYIIHTGNRWVNFIDLQTSLGFWISKRMRFSVGPYFGMLIYHEDYHLIYSVDNGAVIPRIFSELPSSIISRRDFGFRFSFSVFLGERFGLNTTLSEGVPSLFTPVVQEMARQRFQTFMLGVSWRVADLGR